MKKKKFHPNEITYVGTVETLGEEWDQKIDKMVEQAEQDIEEARIHFRWGPGQLVLVKKAAKLIGIPYQTYIKQVVFRQTIQDLKDMGGIA